MRRLAALTTLGVFVFTGTCVTTSEDDMGFNGSGGKRPMSGSRALNGDNGSGGNVGKRIVNAGGAAPMQGATAFGGGFAGQQSVAGGTVQVTPVTQPSTQNPDGETSGSGPNPADAAKAKDSNPA